MKYSVLILFISLSCFAVNASKQSEQSSFRQFLKDHPDRVFAATIESKTRICVKAYLAGELLPNGRIYGKSVRDYSLANKTGEAIREDMKELGCTFREEVLRDPVENFPLIVQSHTIPMWLFLCPDGGVLRVKIAGNPTNSYRKQPNASKGLRYPFDSEFHGFADEVIKVDNEGNPIPKSRDELGPRDLVDGWSEDAHTDLLSENLKLQPKIHRSSFKLN